MCTKSLKKYALLLTFWVALELSPLRAQTITGNVISGDLTVTGTADIQGDSLTLGTRSDNSDFGVQTLYTEATISSLEFDASRAAHVWKWQQNGGTLPLQLQMKLDNTNTLTLYNSSGTAGITLSPTATSTFANSVTVNGTDNEMPNQTLIGPNSVLTESLADSRYVSSSNITTGSATYEGYRGPTLALIGGTASGYFSFAEGVGSTASGAYSTAMGSSKATGGASTALGTSTASGVWSIAMGNSTATGMSSTAMGNSTATGHLSTAMGNSTATGWGATASGYLSTASGHASTAMGSGEASSSFSTAMGQQTTASGAASTAMGYQSTASGNYSTAMGYQSTANGGASTAMGYQSTANGDVSTATGNQTTAPSFAELTMGQFNVGGFASGGDTIWIATDPLLELGNGTDAAHPHDALLVDKTGNVTAGGVITAQPGGDIPMYQGN